MRNRLEASRYEMQTETPKWGKYDTPEKVLEEINGLNARAGRLYEQAWEEKRIIDRLKDQIERLKQEIEERRRSTGLLFDEAHENTYWASKIAKMFVDHEKQTK